ncbi:protein TMA23 [Lipomyces kononenkoae]
MNSTTYLTSYGWTPGSGFRKDSIAKPILVHHKKDTKGLGNNALDHETWWERVFDGRLQELDVYNSKSGSEDEAQNVRGARDSPLYKMFVKGEGLRGSIGCLAASGPQEMEVETNVVTTVKVQSNGVTVERKITEVDKVVTMNSSKKRSKDKKSKDKIKQKRSGQSKTQDDWVRAMLKDVKKKKWNTETK